MISKETMALLNSVIDVQLDVHARTYFKLLLLTGVRRKDLLNAKWSDLDVDSNQLEISGLTGKSFIPLSTEVMSLLAKVPRVNGSDYIIFTGKQNRDTAFNRVWQKLTSSIGLEITLHELRRWTANQLIQSGKSIEEVMSNLGHKPIDFKSIGRKGSVYKRFVIRLENHLEMIKANRY